MAKVFRNICITTHTITDQEGTSFTLERGKEYITSPVREEDQTVVVFSQYWVRVPAALFAGQEPLQSIAR